MRHFLSILFGAAFTCAAAWSIGRVLFARLRISLRAIEHELLAGIAGAALFSLLIFLLCAVHLALIPVFWAIGFGALALNYKYGAGPARADGPSLPRLWKYLIAAPWLFYAVIYLSNSIAPENSPDGEAYHLGLVYRYFRQHGFERLTTNMYANLSGGMEMLFLFAFSFGRHAAAATLHCCFLFALPLMMFTYTRRIGHPVAGACAGMMVYLSPLAGIDGVSAYNDVGVAAAGFATFYLIEIWREQKQPALLIPAGLAAGFCFAIKYTGFVAVAYVLCMVAWEYRSGIPRRRALISLVTVAGLAALIAAPWLLKNWLWLGNPVSPFFNRVFPNPYTHISFENEYRRYFRTYDLPGFRPLFWMVTVNGQLGGQIGPVFLLTPLALLSLRIREGRRILLAGLFFLLPYPQNLGARFLIPALPYAALGIALALGFSRGAQAALVMLAALLAWPSVADKYSTGGWRIADAPWRAALGIIPQDTFLHGDAGWITARMLDEFVPAGKNVWSTTPVAEAYLVTNVLVNYYSAEGELIEDILNTPINADFQPVWNFRYTFTSRTLTHLRITQRGADANEMWSIGELRFFSGDHEIQPARAWKLSASAFPWDIGLAFDRNSTTRWRSWEPLRPAMYVDVDFGAPVELDRIEVHCSHDESAVDMRLDGIEARMEKREDPPPGDLRRLATATVKARGIDYLLIGGDDVLAPDIDRDPARWGLQKVADRGATWLLKIQ